MPLPLQTAAVSEQALEGLRYICAYQRDPHAFAPTDICIIALRAVRQSWGSQRVIQWREGGSFPIQSCQICTTKLCRQLEKSRGLLTSYTVITYGITHYRA